MYVTIQVGCKPIKANYCYQWWKYSCRLKDTLKLFMLWVY